MSSWAGLFFVMSIFLLTDTSPTISSPLEVEPRLQEGALSSECPSCSMSQMRKNLSSSGDQSDMMEAVKRHILNMLHLSARPNLTMPVPRAALLNAIKKLHVGRVTEDGTVEILEESSGPGTSTAPEPPSELIIFGEPGHSPNTVTFDILKNSGSGAVVEEANVWIFLKMSKVSRVRRKVMLQLLWTCRDGGSHKDEFVSEKMVDSRRSGWHTVTVTHSVQTLLDGGSTSLSLQVSCPLCAEVGALPILTPGHGAKGTGQDQSHRPFLMVILRASEEPQRRVKRGLECNGQIHVCCKRQFYVNFKDIGWSDWIIAPSGYHANYCEGDCPSHMGNSALSFHAAVISHYRMRGYAPFQNMKSCCVPTRLRTMSMLYYNEEQKIIKKDIQNMIVDECGCS